jgi:hypothetical protein
MCRWHAAAACALFKRPGARLDRLARDKERAVKTEQAILSFHTEIR